LESECKIDREARILRQKFVKPRRQPAAKSKGGCRSGQRHGRYVPFKALRDLVVAAFKKIEGITCRVHLRSDVD
jgi:hypothetical protein